MEEILINIRSVSGLHFSAIARFSDFSCVSSSGLRMGWAEENDLMSLSFYVGLARLRLG